MARQSRPVWGAWIESAYHQEAGGHYYSRAPHGARGLKWILGYHQKMQDKSRAAWGAWIEITISISHARLNPLAPRMGRVD